MEFNYIPDGIDAIVIDNFYDEQQLSRIMEELKWITKKEIMVGPDKLSTAENEHGTMAKKTGVFLETIFQNWQHSSLIKYPMDNFTRPDVRKKIEEFNSLFRLIYWSDARTHLLSYYENQGFYEGHTDTTVFTVLNWFHTSPKMFEGGDIILSSFNSAKKATVQFKHNRVVVIPGCCNHEVSAITSNITPETYDGNGRYCNAIFLNMRGDPREKPKK
jgi:hypothetical protein